MPIITIYQGASSGGGALAKSVAQALGYRCVGREVLVKVSQHYAIPEVMLNQVIESLPEANLNELLESTPLWWDRWLENLRSYRVALQAAMCEVAQGGNLVYHGHVGHELLPGIRHVLKVLLTAPMEFRIEKVRAQQRLDEAAARRYIEGVDKGRTRRLTALFGADWRDPTRYNLVLNVAEMSLEAVRHLIVEAARLEEYHPTVDSMQDFLNLSLTIRVQATLMRSPRLRNLIINVLAEQGQVWVLGLIPISKHEITELLLEVPGVTNVVTEFVNNPVAALN